MSNQNEANVIAAEITDIVLDWHLCDPDQIANRIGQMDACISLIKKFQITKDELSAGLNTSDLATRLSSKLTGGN